MHQKTGSAKQQNNDRNNFGEQMHGRFDTGDHHFNLLGWCRSKGFGKLLQKILPNTVWIKNQSGNGNGND